MACHIETTRRVGRGCPRFNGVPDCFSMPLIKAASPTIAWPSPFSSGLSQITPKDALPCVTPAGAVVACVRVLSSFFDEGKNIWGAVRSSPLQRLAKPSRALARQWRRNRNRKEDRCLRTHPGPTGRKRYREKSKVKLIPRRQITRGLQGIELNNWAPPCPPLASTTY